jgi:hypothetical protein
MEKLYRGPYIDAYCQIWFHLAKLFQRRRLKYGKHVKLVKIYMPCNFEVNLNTHLGVIALFSSFLRAM